MKKISKNSDFDVFCLIGSFKKACNKRLAIIEKCIKCYDLGKESDDVKNNPEHLL